MRSQRHTLQLCAQIAQTLHLVLLDSQDDDLRELMVLEVTPLAGAGTLLVRVGYPARALSEVARVQEKVSTAAKALRWEVAAAITRRKAPELLFQVVAMKGPGTSYAALP